MSKSVRTISVASAKYQPDACNKWRRWGGCRHIKRTNCFKLPFIIPTFHRHAVTICHVLELQHCAL